MFCRCCITPHFFQLIKFPGFRQHYMHHHIYIINQHPLQLLKSFMMIRVFVTFFLYTVFHIICYSPYLWLLLASQIIKKSATASFIFLRSREIIFSPFFSWIAAIMVLMIFEFLVNRVHFFLRLVSDAIVPNMKLFFVLLFVVFGWVLHYLQVVQLINYKPKTINSFTLSKIAINCHNLLPQNPLVCHSLNCNRLTVPTTMPGSRFMLVWHSMAWPFLPMNKWREKGNGARFGLLKKGLILF